MNKGPRYQTIGFRLSTAIAVLFLVSLMISAISLWHLRSAESWLDKIHRETLAEVSSALELSAGAANLATTAPFLLTVQLPFQLQVEADEIVSATTDMEILANGDADLVLPLARMRVAVTESDPSLHATKRPSSGYRSDRFLISRAWNVNSRGTKIRPTMSWKNGWFGQD